MEGTMKLKPFFSKLEKEAPYQEKRADLENAIFETSHGRYQVASCSGDRTHYTIGLKRVNKKNEVIGNAIDIEVIAPMMDIRYDPEDQDDPFWMLNRLDHRSSYIDQLEHMVVRPTHQKLHIEEYGEIKAQIIEYAKHLDKKYDVKR